MNTVSLEKQRLLVNQDEMKREKMKAVFDYYIDKMKSSLDSLNDKHIYISEDNADNKNNEELVNILEANINDFKIFLDSVSNFEKEILKKFIDKTVPEQQ